MNAFFKLMNLLEILTNLENRYIFKIENSCGQVYSKAQVSDSGPARLYRRNAKDAAIFSGL